MKGKRHFQNILLVLITAVLVFIISSGLVLAQDTSTTDPDTSTTDPDTSADSQVGTGDPNYGNCCPDDATRVCICDPLSPDLMGAALRNRFSDDAGQIEAIVIGLVGRLSKAVLAPIGAFAFLFFVIGGFYWIFSAGNEERIKKGKDIMLWATVGLIVVFSSYALLVFIFNALGILQE